MKWIVLAMLAAVSPALAADVLCGADVLKRDGYKILDGRRVALVTNQTGRDREGNRLVDLLAAAPNVKLVKLLAPEHGMYGVQDERIKDTVDPKTKLPVLSIYGETRKPSKPMLEARDVLGRDEPAVGQFLAQHAQHDGGAALHGDLSAGGVQCFGRARDESAVRVFRRAVD